MSQKNFLDEQQVLANRITPEASARAKAEYKAKSAELDRQYNIHIGNGGNKPQPNVVNVTVIPVETDG